MVAGIGAGIITFPIMIRYLLEFFAWRGTFLILSGIALNLCVCGAVMRPKSTDKVSLLFLSEPGKVVAACMAFTVEAETRLKGFYLRA